MMAFTGQRGVDRVVDVDFGGNIATTLKLMAMNSTIAVYATNGNRNPVVPMRELMEKCIALRALVLFALPPPLLAAAQADISKWLAAGPRIHNIAGQFALSDTAQAHLAVEKGDKLGTVIVDCARIDRRQSRSAELVEALGQIDRPASARRADSCAVRPLRPSRRLAAQIRPIPRWCRRRARAASGRPDRSARPRSAR